MHLVRPQLLHSQQRPQQIFQLTKHNYWGISHNFWPRLHSFPRCFPICMKARRAVGRPRSVFSVQTSSPSGTCVATAVTWLRLRASRSTELRGQTSHCIYQLSKRRSDSHANRGRRGNTAPASERMWTFENRLGLLRTTRRRAAREVTAEAILHRRRQTPPKFPLKSVF